MDNEKDYLDKLYSEKFEKFEFQSTGDDWNQMNSKLGKSNFLKFSFATFNIFILGALIAFAGSATYFGVNHIIQSNKIESLEKKIEVLQDQVNKNEPKSIIIDSASIEKNEKKQEFIDASKGKKGESIDNIKENKNEKIVLTEANTKKDSIIVKPDSIFKAEAQKIKKVKKTVFIKKDKVLVTDTVRIKKKDK
jgi:hypothetical protein